MNDSPAATGFKPDFGCAKGKIWIADDFDEPLDEMREYMEGCVMNALLNEEEIMTDYQFKSLIKMVYSIVKNAPSKEAAEAEILRLITDDDGGRDDESTTAKQKSISDDERS